MIGTPIIPIRKIASMASMASLAAAALVFAAAADAQTGPAGTAPAATVSAPAALILDEQAPTIIAITLNKARQVTLPRPMRDVIVANPEIADIIVKSPRQVYLVAKKIGVTNVFFLGKDGNTIEHMVLRVEIEIDQVREVMKTLLPAANIDPIAVNDTIVLKGTVRNAVQSADAAAIARRFVKGDANVINMLRVLADQQVLLKMRIAEVQRNVLKTMGATTSFSRTRGGRTFTLNTAGANAGLAADDFATIVLPINKFGLRTSTLSALERRGLVKTLAEPALTAISGETANFLAGGEFPIPTGRDSNGNITIEFKKFGVGLSFTPVVLANNMISLRVKTEVSRTSEENQLTLSDTIVKGLSVRRAESTVTLRSGDSIMIAGLLQADEFNTIEGVPWLKDIPILGALFSSRSFQNDETELVVLVTAYLVRPVPPGVRLSAPSDGFVSASDFDIYVLGRLYNRYSKRKPVDEIPVPRGPLGYIMK